MKKWIMGVFTDTRLLKQAVILIRKGPVTKGVSLIMQKNQENEMEPDGQSWPSFLKIGSSQKNKPKLITLDNVEVYGELALILEKTLEKKIEFMLTRNRFPQDAVHTFITRVRRGDAVLAMEINLKDEQKVRKLLIQKGAAELIRQY